MSFFAGGISKREQLQQAVANSDMRLLRDLMPESKKLNRKFLAELMYTAVDYGNTAALVELLKLGADPDTKDETEKPAIVAAARHNNMQIIDILLENGAHINAADKNGKTALDNAYVKGYMDIALHLISKGALTGRDIEDTLSRRNKNALQDSKSD